MLTKLLYNDRQHREGSYTSSKPPRGDDKERRYDERERERGERAERRRHDTAERQRRYDDERRRAERHRGERHRDRERFEHRYRDIDPRKYGSLRRSKDYKDDDERRKG